MQGLCVCSALDSDACAVDQLEQSVQLAADCILGENSELPSTWLFRAIFRTTQEAPALRNVSTAKVAARGEAQVSPAATPVLNAMLQQLPAEAVSDVLSVLAVNAAALKCTEQAT